MYAASPITQKKAGYLLLTSAMYHADNFDSTKIFDGLRSILAAEMPLDSLLETLALVELCVWPRFQNL
jgi:hypothetical protein